MTVERFPQKDVDELLTACHRRCCICHRFCGVKIETDHIVPRDEGGQSIIDNAIAVRFECHAEIHSYNDRHPRGRKFRPEELRRHKEQWLETCKSRPDIFTAKFSTAEVGPLQALIDELEFNARVAVHTTHDRFGCLFLEEQFRRAISTGSIATLRDDLKDLLIEAYVVIGRANQHVSGAVSQTMRSDPLQESAQRAVNSIGACAGPIRKAHSALLDFLGTEK
jgi:HNH endonuclease